MKGKKLRRSLAKKRMFFLFALFESLSRMLQCVRHCQEKNTEMAERTEFELPNIGLVCNHVTNGAVNFI